MLDTVLVSLSLISSKWLSGLPGECHFVPVLYEAQSAQQLFGSALGCPSGLTLPVSSTAAAVVAASTAVCVDVAAWRH